MDEDLIKRSDAIKALCDGCGWRESQCDKDKGFWCESGALIRQAIPTIEPKQGEWIPVDNGHHVRCSECGRCGFASDNYCGNCGAEMRGADDE